MESVCTPSDFDAPRFNALVTVPHITFLQELLLRYVARTWGDGTIPNVVSPPPRPRALTILDESPPVIVTPRLFDTLARLHERFGNAVVHFNRVTTHLGYAIIDKHLSEELHTDTLTHFAYATCMPIVVDVLQCIVISSYVHTPVYPPSFRFADVGHQIPFVNTIHSFLENFHTFTHNVFQNAFEWEDVIVAGDAVSACLMTTNTNTIDNNVKCDLYVFSYNALIRTLRFFSNAGVSLFGATPVSTIVCIVGVPCTFVVHTPRYNSCPLLLPHLDLDFCQVAFDGERIWATPACLRAHATHTTYVSPEILPIRQREVRSKGFGVNYACNTPDVMDALSPWDMMCTFTPHIQHTVGEIRHMMMVNLNCHTVASDPLHASAFYHTHAHCIRKCYTSAAFLLSFDTIGPMYKCLPELPVLVSLPWKIIFPRRIWVIPPRRIGVLMQSPYGEFDYTAEGRFELITFVQRLQHVFDLRYGKNTYTCDDIESKIAHGITILPSARIMDTRTHQMLHSIPDDNENMCVCMALTCSMLTTYAHTWMPMFSVNSIDIMPAGMVSVSK